MAGILNILRRTSPDFQATGTDQPRYQATWIVEVNDYIPGGQVIFLAQNSASTNRVPKEGDSLRWVSASSTYRDSGAFALDFNAVLAEPPVDFPHLWKITVGWRAPTPGKDEQPGSAGIPPTARPPEFSIQYHTTQEEITEAWNVIPIGSGKFYTRKLFTKAPITTAANERVHGFYKDRLKAVIVAQRNVSTPAVALNLNNTFEDTINNSNWSTPYIDVARHHARFLRAETGDQIREGAFTFWRMRVSVEIGSTPFYINLPNVGTQILSGDVIEKTRDDDGILEEVALDTDGTFRRGEPITIPYVVHQEKAYGSLPF